MQPRRGSPRLDRARSPVARMKRSEIRGRPRRARQDNARGSPGFRFAPSRLRWLVARTMLTVARAGGTLGVQRHQPDQQLLLGRGLFGLMPRRAPASGGRRLRRAVWYASMNKPQTNRPTTLPTKTDSSAEIATRPRASYGVRFLGWFLLTSSVGLLSCQSMFFL